MAVRVVTDSTSYIPQDLRKRYEIDVVSLSVSFGEDSQRETDVDEDEFYARLESSPRLPTSSQPPLAELIDAFDGPASRGDDTVGVFISSDMSGTFGTAEMARDVVLSRYPDVTIEVVDARSNCMEEGFAVLAAAEAAVDGATAAEAARAARDATVHTRFIFIPRDLENLRKGGRIGTASALLGSMLQVKPILTVTDGVTQVVSKPRTTRRALDELVSRFGSDVREKGLVDVVVHHIDDEWTAGELARRVSEIAHRDVPIIPIGPVIGTHVGRGAVGIVYQTEEPMRK
jgi:DegV family protein with EDD domain